MGMLARKVHSYLIRRKWRRLNSHNGTEIGVVGSPFIFDIVQVGSYTYGGLNVYACNSQNDLRIGSWCSIGPNVTFLLNIEHVTDSLSTYPFKVKVLAETDYEAGTKGGITVGDDVWIGYGATILDGVTIGQGAIIGACAVVVKDVPPYAIVGGVPARVIRYRYGANVVELMKQIDWGVIDNEFVRGHVDLLYRRPITEDDVRALLGELEIKKKERNG